MFLSHGRLFYSIDLHQGDVGHTLVAGPTGSGKSTLLNVLMVQWLRHADAQVVIFDKGRSARVLTEAVGGSWYKPDSDDVDDDGRPAVCFQPLGHVDDDAEAAWALEWASELLRLEKVEFTPRVRGELWETLQNFRALPRPQRTISTLHNLVQDEQVRLALRNYTVDGAHGHLLDADHDTLAVDAEHLGVGRAAWLGIEMQHLMARKAVAVPVLTYLFHRLEARFDGRPTRRKTLRLYDAELHVVFTRIKRTLFGRELDDLSPC